MNNFENARILKAFGDERRLDILMELQNGEMGASELIEKLDIGQSTLSHHMRILCDSGIVHMQKSGKCVYYSISDEGRNHIINIIDALTKINGYSDRRRK